jgi:hypothetical protein
MSKKGGSSDPTLISFLNLTCPSWHCTPALSSYRHASWLASVALSAWRWTMAF